MFFFFFNDTATTEIYTLSLHDALPIFFLLLAACPTMQNLIPHLSQFFDDPSLGFGGFLDIPAGVLDNAEQRLNLGLQLGVFLQSFLQGRFAGNRDRKSTRLNSSHGYI